MKLYLNKIEIKNFKGIKNLEVSFKSTTNIHGANGTGKTSIYDAFLWLLFGKDSAERKDFEIKPLDENGEPIYKLTTEVEASFYVNDEVLILRKTYAEKWTRKRGSSTEEFTGHVTECFVNEVPCAVSEYNKRISEICSEDVFKMLTNTKTFVNLKKEVKRQKLFSLVGEQIPMSCDYTDVEDWLKVKSEDALISECKNKIKRCKDNVATIPARIEEIERQKPNVLNWAEIEGKISELNSQVKTLDNQIADRSQAYKAIMDERQAMAQNLVALKKERLNIISEIEKEVLRDYNQKLSAVKEAKLKKERLAYEISTKKQNIEYLRKRIHDDEASKVKCIEEWKQIKSRQYIAIEELICPTCKQSLPQTDIDAENERLLKAFNAETERLLAANKENGMAYASYIKGNQERIQEQEALIEDFEKQLALIVEIELPEQPSAEKAIAENAQVAGVDAKIYKIELELNTEVSIPDTTELKAQRDEIMKELNKQKELLYVRQYIEHSDARIKELEGMRIADNEAIADCEYKLNRLAEYRKAKVELIEGQINSKFELIKWKLFDTQLNGGEVEVCEPTVGGVPYADLNTAMKINVGLDIINTLSRIEGVSLPIFIDNRESVTKTIELHTQVINLIVDVECNHLEVR